MKSYKKITNINYMENCCKCDEYKEQLDTQNSRITCLEYDNEDQLNRIINLEKEKSKLDNTIITLNEKITTLNEKIIVLEKENQEFKIKNNNLEFNKLRIKIITAIQDLNNYEKLEVKFTYPLNTCIANIRFNRNMSNHYIDINDSLKLIENKKKYLLLQLLNLSEDNIQNLNDRYQIDTCPNSHVIEEVINYLKNNISLDNSIEDITKHELKNIEWWWSD
jgi:chromosome segregation ATPase